MPCPPSPLTSAALGVLLFLFIPAVLFLFVAHPEPVAASLIAGVALMVGHRFLAAPYFRAVRPTTCAWCHRSLGEGRAPTLALELMTPTERLAIFACARHAEPTRRFFGLVDRLRWPLRVGIGLPLALLLAALIAASFGHDEALTPVGELFRLVVGITVNAAALGPLAGPPARVARPAFPVHNFYLLGVRAILWIFRLVGVWWIVSAGSYWLEF